jgi:hypothetical protein
MPLPLFANLGLHSNASSQETFLCIKDFEVNQANRRTRSIKAEEVLPGEKSGSVLCSEYQRL